MSWDGMDWISLAQNRGKWRALVYAAMNLAGEALKWLHNWWPLREGLSIIELVN
jgi:hypothetical protein